LAPTGFCYPGGILQIFLSTRSTNFAAAAATRLGFLNSFDSLIAGSTAATGKKS
jgi:hypothetical protein